MVSKWQMAYQGLPSNASRWAVNVCTPLYKHAHAHSLARVVEAGRARLRARVRQGRRISDRSLAGGTLWVDRRGTSRARR